MFFSFFIISSELTESAESPAHPISPTNIAMSKWDPMSRDFLSVKNTYAVDTDDPDIAIQGYSTLNPFVYNSVLTNN